MKNVLLIAFLTAIGTVAWAQRDKLLSIVSPSIVTEKVGYHYSQTKGEQKTNTSAEQLLVTTDKQSDANERALRMTEAIHEIVFLDTEQKQTVNLINLRFINGVDAVREKNHGEQGISVVKEEMQFASKRRDDKLFGLLNKDQVKKYNDFHLTMNELQNLQMLKQALQSYSSGKRFYPQSEAGGFTSLEEIKERIAEQTNKITKLAYSQADIERLGNAIYAF